MLLFENSPNNVLSPQNVRFLQLLGYKLNTNKKCVYNKNNATRRLCRRHQPYSL